jgi:hypothetical protein
MIDLICDGLMRHGRSDTSKTQVIFGLSGYGAQKPIAIYIVILE